MIEYYLLTCGCIMTAKKINDKEYHYAVVLPRCKQANRMQSDYISEQTPEGYHAKLLSKLEASIEIMQGY